MHATTLMLGLWLSVRGGVIVAFGEYYSEQVKLAPLNSFPFAPESWGWLFLSLGGLVMASVIYNKATLIMHLSVISSTAAGVVGTVMLVSFTEGNIDAAYNVIGWYGIGVLFFIRYITSLRWNI